MAVLVPHAHEPAAPLVPHGHARAASPPQQQAAGHHGHLVDDAARRAAGPAGHLVTEAEMLQAITDIESARQLSEINAWKGRVQSALDVLISWAGSSYARHEEHKQSLERMERNAREELRRASDRADRASDEAMEAARVSRTVQDRTADTRVVVSRVEGRVVQAWASIESITTDVSSVYKLFCVLLIVGIAYAIGARYTDTVWKENLDSMVRQEFEKAELEKGKMASDWKAETQRTIAAAKTLKADVDRLSERIAGVKQHLSDYVSQSELAAARKVARKMSTELEERIMRAIDRKSGRLEKTLRETPGMWEVVTKVVGVFVGLAFLAFGCYKS